MLVHRQSGIYIFDKRKKFTKTEICLNKLLQKTMEFIYKF